ncbi:MAG: hypothetical protein F6K56_17250 [Moorea sp. SIO3G5]|nr:hypothetical protein [Moorena sp. SIO3G5]
MDTRCGRAITLNLLTLAKRPRDRVQPWPLATLREQPWPKGHAIAFNLQP